MSSGTASLRSSLYDLTSEDGLYIARHVLGRRVAPDRRQAGRLAVHATGRAPMSRWKQWVRPPEGALPGGIVTKAGVVLIAVLVGGLLFSWAMTGPQEADTLVALPEAQAVDDGMGRSLQGRIRQEAERQTLEAAARARAELERRQAAAAEEMARLQAESEAPNTAALIPGVSAAESELREALRLEELERRTRSLRALPVSQSYRDPNATAESSDAEGRGTERCGRRGCGGPREHGPSGARLLRAVARGARGRAGGGAASPRVPWHRRCGGARVRAASLPSGTGTRSTRPERPACRPAWAGSGSTRARSSKAVLLTQLTGDFPGPVLAMVSVPFYSADRQRILIPRGARVVGTARAVQDPDQSRLAVAIPPVAHARRQLDRPRVHGSEPGGRGRASGTRSTATTSARSRPPEPSVS